MIFPNDVLKELGSRISNRAWNLLKLIKENPANKQELLRKVEFSMMVLNDELARLEAINAIEYQETGRAKKFYITENGNRFLELNK